MKKKLFTILLIVSMIAVFSFTGCGSKSSDSSSSSSSTGGGKTLIIHDSAWSTIDMFQAEDWNDMQSLVADSILQEDPTTKKAVPRIASKEVWSDNGLTLTLTFPKGMKYSTGEELEPEDVVASIKYGLKVSPYKDGYSNIKSMETKGRDVIIHFSKYQADTEFNFESCFIGVIDKDELDSMSKDKLLWGCHPYGAYYVDDYQPGAYVILKANPGYKTNNPLVKNHDACPVKTIKVVFSGEGFTLSKGIENGDYDVLSQVDSEYYNELKSKSDTVTMVEASCATIDYAEINMTDPLFKDKNVRKAIILGINRDSMKSYLSDFEKPAYNLLVSKVINYDKTAETYYKDNYSYNKAEAEKLLAAAGWKKNSDGILEKNGKTFTFTYKCSDSDMPKKVAQSIQADMKALGIDMKIESKDWSYVQTDVEDGKFQIARMGLGWNEPFLLLDYFCNRNTACTNPDAKAEQAMVAKARSTVDFDSRTQQITKILEKLYDYNTIIPLVDSGGYRCWRSEIKGIVTSPIGDFFVNDIVTDSDGNFRNVAS